MTRIGPANGTLQVRTYREGVAQRAGHDLIIEVEQWEATVEVGEDGALSAVQLEADPRSLEVREGLRGFKPLSDKDRAEIRNMIDTRILQGRPIAFRSSGVETADGGLVIRGELELAGMTRPVSVELYASADRDTVEVVVDVALR